MGIGRVELHLALTQLALEHEPEPALPRRRVEVGPFAGCARGRRVLLTEDNPVNQRVSILMLTRMGASVAVAGNGLEAIEAWRREEWDLVLMDCQMPEMDGFQTTARIRELEEGGRRTPIVVLTANAMLGDRDRCLEAGMDGYLSKPVSQATLGELLERVFRSDEPQPEGAEAHAN